MTSSYQKISGFDRPHVSEMLSDSKISTLESGFKNFRICLRIRRMRVDDSRIRKEKVADSKISGYVWTGPKRLVSFRNNYRLIEKTFAGSLGSLAKFSTLPAPKLASHGSRITFCGLEIYGLFLVINTRLHSFFFIRTSNFDAEAERSYIFWRFEAETFLKMFLNLPGIVFQPISADVTRQTIKEHFLLRYGIKLLAHTGLTCSDATCEMSRQPTLAKFGFKKRIDHRGLQQDINLLDFVAKTPKKFTCSTCSKAFINQQGLSVHVKCVHGVVAEGKILAKSSDSTPKTESENEIQTAVSSTMDKILSLVAEESSSSEKGNTNM